MLNALFLTQVHIGIRRKNEFFNPNISNQFLFENKNFILYNIFLFIVGARKSFAIVYTRFLNKHPIMFFATANQVTTAQNNLAKGKFIITTHWTGGLLTNFRTIFRRSIHVINLANAKSKRMSKINRNTNKSCLNDLDTIIPRIPSALISCSAKHIAINDCNSVGIFSLCLCSHNSLIPLANITIIANVSHPVIMLFLDLLLENFRTAKSNEKKYFLF